MFMAPAVRVSDWLGTNQCWRFVTFWCVSGSTDSYLWLTDLDLDLNLDPDPTTFFSDFKHAKKYFSSYFFLITSVFKHYFSPLNTFMRKEKDPDPYIWLDPEQGGPKTCGYCGSASASPTLVQTIQEVPYATVDSVSTLNTCQKTSSNR